MNDTDARGITLWDALFIVAMTAIGIACARASIAVNYRENHILFEPHMTVDRLRVNASAAAMQRMLIVQDGISCALCLCVSSSIALLFITYRRRDQDDHKILYRPGRCVCLVSLLALLFLSITHFAWWIVSSVIKGELLGWPPIMPFLTDLAKHTGTAVAAVWGVMLLSKSAVGKRDWIEWCGQILGLCFVGLGFSSAIRELLSHWP